MTDAEKIELLIAALNKINNKVFCNPAIILGSEDYFEIRLACTDTIKAVGGEIKGN